MQYQQDVAPVSRIGSLDLVPLDAAAEVAEIMKATEWAVLCCIRNSIQESRSNLAQPAQLCPAL